MAAQRRNKRNPTKSLCKVLYWIRDSKGGRLKKLDRPAEILSEEIIMFDIVHAQSVISERFTIHGQKLAEETTCHNSNYPISGPENTNNGIYLTNLPNELLEHIILYLDVDSVEKLGKVNQRLKNYVDTNYYLHLMLPCDDSLMEQLLNSRRKILRLTSNCTLRNLQDPLTGEVQFTNLNLTALKALCICGNNHTFYNNYRLTLPESYFKCLEDILSKVNPVALTNIEILLDITLNRWTSRIKPLLSQMNNLEKVTLKGHSDDLRSVIDIENYNPVINCILPSISPKIVDLHNFLQCETNPVVIEAPQIVCLSIDLDKSGSIRLFKMNSLVRLDIIGLFTYYRHGHCGCLRHYYEGNLFKDLVREAPNLRYYNDLDLRRIEEMSGSNPEDEDVLPRCRWFNCKIVQDIQLFCDLSKEISDRKHYENKEIRRFRGYDYR